MMNDMQDAPTLCDTGSSSSFVAQLAESGMSIRSVCPKLNYFNLSFSICIVTSPSEACDRFKRLPLFCLFESCNVAYADISMQKALLIHVEPACSKTRK